FGYAVPGFIAAALSAVNGVAAIFFLPESPRVRGRDRERTEPAQAASLRRWAKNLASYPLGLLLLVYFLAIMSFTAMTSVLALFAERAHAMDALDMGIIFSTAGGTTVVVRGMIVGWLAKQYGERRIVQAGTLVLSASLLTIPLVPNEIVMFALVPFWALATGLTFPSLASLVSQATDADSQGAMLGGQQVVGGIGRVLGPVWAGALFESLGIRIPFYVGAALVAVAVVLALGIPDAKYRKRRTEESGAESPPAGVA
ncbi:MAG: MFS transporter, partial [Longimicrobiales bacterium]|nr:MFS transporter [Longimicrobiales bacterium]